MPAKDRVELEDASRRQLAFYGLPRFRAGRGR